MAKAPSVWSYVSKMPPEHLKNVYGDFPQKVRQHLGDWLENQPWEYITGTDSFCIETASSVLNKLVEELEKVASNCGSDARLILQAIQRMSQHDPNSTILLFKAICKGEMDVVLKQYPRLAVSFQAKQEEMMFQYRCNKLQHKMKQTSVAQQSLKVALENLKFRGQAQDLSALQKQWVMLIEESLKLLANVQDQALKIISIWRRRQQMAGNGSPFDENLLPLQDRLEFIFAIYQELICMIRDLSETGQRVLPPEYLDQISAGFTSLIKSSFLVDKQPPQVLKTQTKFQASVNFMLGAKILAGVSKMPVIRANIITEKKAQDFFVAPSTEPLNEGAGEVENGRSVFEFTQATRTCGAVFKNMLLKKIKRCERKGSESVTEEKCAIFFTAEINFSGSTHVIQVKALSLPVVVIVHGNQDNNAKATILWDNAFSEIGRRPFYVDEKVPWKKMCQTLNMKFMAEVGTKQELTPVHYRFLAQKIFGDNGSYEDIKDRMVSWTQFNKEPLRERNFTFWQWFDGVVDLTKKHLKDYWSDGLIMGFVSKQYVHTILGRAHNGTFLLRFSDSEIGGITIAHIVRGDDGSGQIQNIQPFTAKDLQILSLGDRVRDLKQLKYLHEKGEKDAVFDKYYKKVSSSGNGYKRAVIILTVPGDENESKHNPSHMSDIVSMDECDAIHASTSRSLQYA
ncbi:PREDICTED: signal transducer and activator of transcription 6 [Nanorana parkeri]|uniref:signal transducer and activator of transcription 6 n=1 Tax=Nanorana parkeri TaxID=125878 RepID=UPI000853FC3A|nr:PREDICTED: signal transducer and activator of transcription 6 [Nanorana parkeri]